MKTRNRFFMFIFMGAFQGIYLIYFMGSVQNGLKTLRMKKMGAVITILLSIITLGLYSFVWQWNTCTSLKKLGCGDCRFTCLILSLLIIGIIINPLIIQGRINYYFKQINRKLY